MELGWRALGEIFLAAFIAVEGWLLRKVWNSKLDREEAMRMFEEWAKQDEVRDAMQFKSITEQITREITQRDVLHRENLRQQELMRAEARDCFKDVGERIDGIYELLAKPRGH